MFAGWTTLIEAEAITAIYTLLAETLAHHDLQAFLGTAVPRRAFRPDGPAGGS